MIVDPRVVRRSESAPLFSCIHILITTACSQSFSVCFCATHSFPPQRRLRLPRALHPLS
jgi:hypothetical protein